MTIVEIQQLTKAYGGQPPALRDVDLEIGEGVTGLLGPNGAGKSTLIQCVLGLLPDYTGDVRVLGMDARSQRRAIRRRVGFMPETDAYLADMTGIKSVRFLAQLTGLPYSHALRRAHEVLFHVGLGEAVYREVREYSTGMRQRFKLAQALVHDPELIFLDEPLAGLDPAGRTQLLGLIRDLATEHGKHVVWSSHILPDVQRVADAITVLHDGRSRGTFRLDDLDARENTCLVDAEGDYHDLERALRTAEGVALLEADRTAEEGTARAGGAFVVELDGDPRPVYRAIASASGRVRRLAPMAESLEDVFMRLLESPAEERTGA